MASTATRNQCLTKKTRQGISPLLLCASQQRPSDCKQPAPLDLPPCVHTLGDAGHGSASCIPMPCTPQACGSCICCALVMQQRRAFLMGYLQLSLTAHKNACRRNAGLAAKPDSACHSAWEVQVAQLGAECSRIPFTYIPL